MLTTAFAVGLVVLAPRAGATSPEPVQRGDDIDGEAAGDEFGYAVALSEDGLTVAISARNNDGGGSNAGHVRVHRWDGSAWTQRGGDIDGEAAGDQSGYAVALSADGSIVAIGVPFNDGGGANAGHVRVFRWDGAAWVQRGGDIDGEAAGDESGYAVALSADGSIVAVGARRNDGEGNSDGGHVRVHEWDADSTSWVQRGGDIDGEAAGDFSGWSVAMSDDGSIVAIGARDNDGNGGNAGHVRVYRWDGAAWVQRGGDIDGEAAGDGSGYAVASSADGLTVAIGARNNDDGGLDAGHVRVFRWDGSAWVQRGDDVDGEAAGDVAGFSVSSSADGRTVAVGARFNDGGGSNAGHVRVLVFPADPGAVVAASPPAVSCVPSVPVAREMMTCMVTGGDPGIDILWRAAYNPVIAEAGVTLDDAGSGEFSFMVPAAAVGEELTVELVEWIAPVSLGVVGGKVPAAIPAGEGPVSVWSFLLAMVIAFGLLGRRTRTAA